MSKPSPILKTTLARRPATVVALLALGASPVTGQTTGTCEVGQATVDLDIGNVRARMYNTGGLFWIRGNPTYEVPRGTVHNAIFATSLWIGGMTGGELRMAAATYADWEFWPGPLDAQGNPPADCAAYDRIYLVDRADLERFDATGEATGDIRDWPWQLGAPVADGDGNPDNYDLAGGDRPEILGDQMAWWVMNDAGNQHGRGGTDPIGLEIQVSAFAFARDDAVGNSTFYRYRLRYKGAAPWEAVHFGIWSDPDVGDAGDDYVASDSLLGMGYAYNGDAFDGSSAGYGDRPPAVGYDIIRGPLADADGIDNDYDGQVDEAGEVQSMTSFVYYLGSSSAQGNPTGAVEEYYYLRAQWRDGVPITVGGTGRGYSTTPTRFMFSGNPPAFWTDDQPTPGGTPHVPSDRRFIMATGPFSMQPDETVDIWLAIVWSRGTDRLDSVRRLKEESDVVQRFFDDGMTARQLPPPNTVPSLIVPADGVIGQSTKPTLQWEAILGITRYEVEIDNDADFSSPLLSRTVPATTVTPNTRLPTDVQLHWRVRSVNFAGVGPWSNTRKFTTRSNLDQNYPNPFRSTTTIRYAVFELAPVSLEVFDVTGRRVARLVDEMRIPGEYETVWTAGNHPAGLYFYRLTVGSQTYSRAMLLLR